MPQPLVIHWFRQDLRLEDNPALCAAVRLGRVLPIYILDDENAGEQAPGGASRWWLHHSLAALNRALKGKLALFRGDAARIIEELVARERISAVCWNRCYEPWRVARDRRIKSGLEAAGVEVRTLNGSLLWEPWESVKGDGTPYRVFTPYYRNCRSVAPPPREPLPKPAPLRLATTEAGVPLEQLGLLPRPRWDRKLARHWQIGEAGAGARLQTFLAGGLEGYREGRDFPARNSVSRLSPHLHFGELSPHQVWHGALQLPASEDGSHFLRELAWREFSHHLLYHFPHLPRRNLQAKFDRFPWRRDRAALRRWQRGLTGYPIVDAGMRELWETGYMHNRVRMIVGSFLVKNLLLHWHEGERWFRDCLVDFDLANNSASWQWVAGTGADAAPYFRIFNPVTQGEKFDRAGDYTRTFVPELARLPDRYLFHPWDAPASVLAEAGVVLGQSYPEPMVDVKGSRESALAAFATIRGSADA